MEEVPEERSPVVKRVVQQFENQVAAFPNRPAEGWSTG
jgi:hypothetical protein